MKNLKAYYVVNDKGSIVYGPVATRATARMLKVRGERIVQLAQGKVVR